MIITPVIFCLTIALVIWRPKPLNEASAAAIGAVIFIIIGVVSPLSVLNVFRENLNVLLFFLGLMVISVIAEKAGFFEWCAFKATGYAHGKSTTLLAIVFGLGTAITAFFSNDATALILTPIVFTLVKKLKLNALPFVFACAFIANTASMLLPVSNPVNLLAVEKFNITLFEYLKYLLLPSVILIAVNLLLFRWLFRKELKATAQNGEPENPVKIDKFFIAVCSGLGLTALGYILVSIYGFPLSYPSMGGAVYLLTCALMFKRIDIKTVNSGISWSVLVFIFALAVLVRGLENAGIIDLIASEISTLAAQGPLQALSAVTLGTAVGSNLINNWSMMMVSVSSLSALNGGFDRALIYGAVMGADIGPNISILGSLSSMLWLMLLRKRGLNIHPTQYLKLGLIVTPILLITGILALWGCAAAWG